jgi:hypothetical protein
MAFTAIVLETVVLGQSYYSISLNVEIGIESSCPLRNVADAPATDAGLELA